MSHNSSPSRLRVALIGCGKFGRFLIKTLRTSPAIDIVAVSDKDPVALDKVRQRFGITALYAEPTAILQDKTIDAVHIVTAPSTHTPIALEALKAGKHVLVEKPLALTSTDAQQLVTTAESAQRVLAVNFIMRYNPITKVLQTLVQNKAFGTLKLFRIENIAHQLPPEHWFWDLAQSGGIHREHGVHFFDVVSQIVGREASQVDGRLVFRGTQNTEAVATVQFPDNLIAHFSHAFIIQKKYIETTTWLITWDRGYALVNGWIPLSMTLRVNATPAEKDLLTTLGFEIHDLPQEDGLLEATFTTPGPKESIYANHIQEVWNDVVAGIRTGSTVPTNAASAIQSVVMAERASQHQIHVPANDNTALPIT